MEKGETQASIIAIGRGKTSAAWAPIGLRIHYNECLATRRESQLASAAVNTECTESSAVMRPSPLVAVLIVLSGLASWNSAFAATLEQRQVIVRRIDDLLAQKWADAGVQSAAVATDGEFLRRAYLDINGIIPRVSEVRSFLADDHPDKREQLVERLLRSPRYSTHLATVWSNRILPAGAEEAHPVEAVGLQKWLRTRFAKNLRYDSLVAGLLLATGSEELGPALYFRANDVTPEKLAASVSELFLGVKLQCAQCHDHPYSEYSQKDFWGLAAFFAQVRAPENRGMRVSYQLIDANRGEVTIPDTDEVVPPRYLLDGNEVDASFGSRRASLVLWLTSRDNPFFARAGVNWAWTHFFGAGLIDLEDQRPEQADSVNQQIIDTLTDYFVSSGFDMRELLQTIASTRAYQLSSWEDVPEQAEPDLFAAMAPRPLSPEQLYDSFLLLAPRLRAGATQYGDAPIAVPTGMAADPVRVQFVRRMREPPGSATEYRAGTLQVLMLMNGMVTGELTAHDRSRLLGALTAPYMTDAERVEALFLATLCRGPADDESTLILESLTESADEDDRNRVLSDLLWALVNSTEFAFNR